MSFLAERKYCISLNSEAKNNVVSELKHHVMKMYEGVYGEKRGPAFRYLSISLLYFHKYKQNYSESFYLNIIKIPSNSEHCLAYTRNNHWNVLPS
jgi:hypothetical protein